ncbi:MAG: GTP pyrophosphokinase family protein [Clostridia bacterium]|nr:GTP pyrophosphokinase family protein [Clostridia bacterium]
MGLRLPEGTSAEDILHMGYSFMKLMSYYNCAMMELETKFNVLNEEFSLLWDRQPISSIKTRLKDPLSIRNKLVRKGCPVSIESIEQNINDVAGIRVVCSFIEDVYMLAEAFKQQDDVTIIEEKDYIACPKDNGYRSLHLIVAVPIFLQHEKRIMKAEVQIRTIAMDFWASLEHQLMYKKTENYDAEMAADIKYCAALSAELDKRMDDLRARVYPTEPSEEDVLKATLAELPIIAGKM